MEIYNFLIFKDGENMYGAVLAKFLIRRKNREEMKTSYIL